MKRITKPAPPPPLPFNLEAEQAVLGAMLLSPEAVEIVRAALLPADFYMERHALLFEAFVAMAVKGLPLDLVTVQENLRTAGELDAAGGLAYITALFDTVHTVANTAHYVRIVREKASLRKLIGIGESLAQKAQQAGPDDKSQELIGLASSALSSLTTDEADSNVQDVCEVVDRLMEKIEARSENPGALLGLATGLYALDNWLCGLQAPDMIVVGGRPGMGKSSLVTTIMESLIVRSHPCLLFTMEMNNEQAVLRMICSMAKLDQRDVRRGLLDEHGWARYQTASRAIRSTPFRTVQHSGMTPSRMRSLMRAFQKRYGGVGLVAIDYIQLMRSDRRSDNKLAEMTDVSMEVKAMAREFNCPLIAVASLNRSCESREDKRPLLSDLRETGQFESDADIVMMLYNEEYYRKKGMGDTTGSTEAQKVELLVRKNRFGPAGTIYLGYTDRFTRFEDWEDTGLLPSGATGF